MKLALVSIEKDGTIRLAAEGEITSNDFYDAGGKNPFEAAVGASWASNRVMLNLENVTFLDSSAIGWLIESQRKVKASGGKLILHSAPPRVRDVFDLLKMHDVLNVKKDESAARVSLGIGTEAK
jgi:anti-anti-sigma factor